MKRALLLSLAGLLVLSSGCRKHGTDYTSSENTGDVSLVVSETTAENETVSPAENVSSTLSANVAQGSSAESSNIAKPNKTVFKYQKTLVQDHTSCMIEISFCELSGILEKGIKGINNGEIE